DSSLSFIRHKALPETYFSFSVTVLMKQNDMKMDDMTFKTFIMDKKKFKAIDEKKARKIIEKFLRDLRNGSKKYTKKIREVIDKFLS
ncbi:12351_t:CDS:2, partial [Gigaspora rosea]